MATGWLAAAWSFYSITSSARCRIQVNLPADEVARNGGKSRMVAVGTGQFTAPPIAAMNVRRLIRSPGPRIQSPRRLPDRRTIAPERRLVGKCSSALMTSR
jgi:hypothetical protein